MDVINEPPIHTLAGGVVNINPSQLCNRNMPRDIGDVGGEVVNYQPKCIPDLVEGDVINTPPTSLKPLSTIMIFCTVKYHYIYTIDINDVCKAESTN